MSYLSVKLPTPFQLYFINSLLTYLLLRSRSYTESRVKTSKISKNRQLLSARLTYYVTEHKKLLSGKRHVYEDYGTVLFTRFRADLVSDIVNGNE